MIFVCKSCESVLVVKSADKFRVTNGDRNEILCPVCGKVSGEPMRRVY